MTYENTRNEKVAVGTSSVEVAQDQDGKRKVIYIYNSSSGTQKITVCFGRKTAVSGEGVVLTPGQSIIDSKSLGYECYQGVITAIADAAGGQLSIYER